MLKLKHGILIAIEGIDGSGKSTLAKNLYTLLQEKKYQTVLTKEPGGTALGQQLRNIVQEKKVPVCSQAEFLLFATDRAQHFHELVIPQLNAGALIISDRMSDSSLVYQGFGRGLDTHQIQAINSWAMHGKKPDITFYIKVTIQTATARIKARNEALTSFEKEKQDFIQKLIEGFDALYKNRNDVIIIDGNQTEEYVTTQALTALITWITQNQLILP